MTKPFNVLTYLTFILMFLIASSSHSLAANKHHVHYDRNTDQVTLSSNGGSLKEILKDIALQSGIDIYFDSEAERRVYMTLQDIDLDKGIKRLIRYSNYAMVYEKVLSKNGSQIVRLKRISVFKESEQDATKLIVSNNSTTLIQEKDENIRMSNKNKSRSAREKNRVLKALKREERAKKRRERLEVD